MKNTLSVLSLFFFLSNSFPAKSQIQSLRFDEPNSLTINGLVLQKKQAVTFSYGVPLFSVLIDSNFYNSYCGKAAFGKNEISFVLADSIQGSLKADKKFQPGLRYILRFTNTGKGNHRIENLVPLGEGSDKVYITAGGTK